MVAGAAAATPLPLLCEALLLDGSTCLLPIPDGEKCAHLDPVRPRRPWPNLSPHCAATSARPGRSPACWPPSSATTTPAAASASFQDLILELQLRDPTPQPGQLGPLIGPDGAARRGPFPP